MEHADRATAMKFLKHLMPFLNVLTVSSALLGRHRQPVVFQRKWLYVLVEYAQSFSRRRPFDSDKTSGVLVGSVAIDFHVQSTFSGHARD